MTLKPSRCCPATQETRVQGVKVRWILCRVAQGDIARREMGCHSTQDSQRLSSTRREVCARPYRAHRAEETSGYERRASGRLARVVRVGS